MGCIYRVGRNGVCMGFQAVVTMGIFPAFYPCHVITFPNWDGLQPIAVSKTMEL